MQVEDVTGNLNSKPTAVLPKHPEYSSEECEWQKYRLTYEAGDAFIDEYLERFTGREEIVDYDLRRSLTYCPAFAQAALDEIKNAIVHRMCDVHRKGGSKSYQDAVAGRRGGVSCDGFSMNTFIGMKVLPELLPMRKVGIFVDKEVSPDTVSRRTAAMSKPYLYIYRIEDIINWEREDAKNPNWYTKLLVRHCEHVVNAMGLPVDTEEKYRFYYIADDGFVAMQTYVMKENEQHVMEFVKEGEPFPLRIKRIPFVLMELPKPLLRNVANYQIAETNIYSATVFHTIKVNFPIYTEQFDPKTEEYLARPASVAPPVAIVPNKEASNLVNDPVAGESRPREVAVGVGKARAYPIGAERPGFVSPSTDPLTAANAFCKKMEDDIRLLVNLSVSGLSPRMSSGESKQYDLQAVESGLAFIGELLQTGEVQISEVWGLYEGSDESAEVSYPENYSLRTSQERIDLSLGLQKTVSAFPSITTKKEITKRAIDILLHEHLTSETREKMYKEIDDAPGVIVTSDEIIKLIEAGVLDSTTAEQIVCLPEGTAKKAASENVDRLAAIAIAQAPNMGAGAAAPVAGVTQTPEQAKNEKKQSQDATIQPTPGKAVRGEGK